MTDEATMLAAYAVNYPDETDRLILADWLEERGDIRGTWLRDADLARVMGPTLQDPVAALLADLRKKKTRRLLVSLGCAAMPGLLAALPGSGKGRGQILEILTAIGQNELAEPIRELGSDDPNARIAALAALAELGLRAVPAIAAILRLFHDPNEQEVCQAAVDALARLGALADAALIAAAAEIHPGDRETCRALHETIAKRGLTSPAVCVLLQSLVHGNWDTCESASDALYALGPDVFELVLTEGEAADDYRREYVYSLLRSFPDAQARLLAAAMDTTRTTGRCCAILTLIEDHEGRIGPERDWLIPHLIELTGDESRDVARTATYVLGWFGERAAAAVPTLVALLDREDGWLADTIITALARIIHGANN